MARVELNRGPAGGRNLAAEVSRADFVAFTDDDCLPQQGWLAAFERSFAEGCDLVQGRTVPDPIGAATAGPWDRTIRIERQTSLFETCNIAYRRSRFEAAGGFDEHDPLTDRRLGRAFGEDVLLGSRVVQEGGRAVFEPGALVYHRYLNGTYRDWLAARRQLVDFPALGRRSEVVAAIFWHRLFLNRKTAAFDLAIASGVASVLARRAWLAAGVAPWVSLRWPAARRRKGGHPLVRLAQIGLGDLVELLSLLEGSARHRRLLL